MILWVIIERGKNILELACNPEEHWVFGPLKLTSLPVQVLQAPALLSFFSGASQGLVTFGVCPAWKTLCWWWFKIYFPLYKENNIWKSSSPRHVLSPLCTLCCLYPVTSHICFSVPFHPQCHSFLFFPFLLHWLPFSSWCLFPTFGVALTRHLMPTPIYPCHFILQLYSTPKPLLILNNQYQHVTICTINYNLHLIKHCFSSLGDCSYHNVLIWGWKHCPSYFSWNPNPRFCPLAWAWVPSRSDFHCEWPEVIFQSIYWFTWGWDSWVLGEWWERSSHGQLQAVGVWGAKVKWGWRKHSGINTS